MTVSTSSIRKMRVCPEHMCRIFEIERLWARMEAGEFILYTHSKPRNPPFVDHKGQKCVTTEEHFLRDERYPSNDDRHIVLRAHCFRTEDGSIGASGKMDPKEIMLNGINYRQLDPSNPHCELCEGGDRIPVEQRFFNSKYKPTVPTEKSE